MRLPIVIADADEHQRRLREDEEERLLEQEAHWECEDRAGAGPWGIHAHRLARRERARRAEAEQRGEPA